MSSFAIIILLVFTALVLGASTLASHRRLSWKGSLTQGLGGLLWASPVIAVLAFVAMRVIPFFQFGTVSHQAPNGTPSWLQTEEGTADVEDVPSFAEPLTPVSIDLEKSSKDELPEWTSHKVHACPSPKAIPNRKNGGSCSKAIGKSPPPRPKPA